MKKIIGWTLLIGILITILIIIPCLLFGLKNGLSIFLIAFGITLLVLLAMFLIESDE